MKLNCFKFLILLSLVSALVSPARGEEVKPTSEEPVKPTVSRFAPDIREHSFKQTATYILALYTVTWAGYILQQDDAIENKGSWKNYSNHMKSPTFFDGDLFTYNWVVHTITGSQAFLFYRAKAYSNTDAFLLTAFQELLFEFTIETLTERPSVEDIFYTPILGSLLGTLLERSSYSLLENDSPYIRALAYILNPPMLLGLHEKVQFYPWTDNKAVGLALRAEF